MSAGGDSFVGWAKAVLGSREGGTRQRRWAAASGISPSDPWCAAFVAYGLKRLGVDPPSEAAYTGSWLSWSGGEKVDGLDSAQPGDLIVIDWGDGGRTDHIGVYAGNHRMIAGNNSNNSVGVSAVPDGNVVGIVRPKKFGGDSGGSFFGDLYKDALGLSTSPVTNTFESAKDIISGPVGAAASDVAGEVISQLADLLGVNAAAILLNIGLVGGGAFLAYYGIARAVGVDKPVVTPLKAAPVV
jgi:hypothetical protein